MNPEPTSRHAAYRAVAELYHTYFTGLLLSVSSRRGADDAGRWVEQLFRHQHEQKFLSSFDKLGLREMPDAVACAAYHYLSNAVGGVRVEFMRESDRKAWVRFVPPRWVYPGASICGIPSEVSRAMLRGWYARNGVSLRNPRLGFVCTAQTTDGQHGLAGYFLEHDHELAPEARLRFAPGELPPPFDPALAPRLPAEQWPQERLAKAERNYAMEYVRTGLPRLAELFGPAEAASLGRVTGLLVGAQCYAALAAGLGAGLDAEQGARSSGGGADPAGFARLLQALARAEGDDAEIEVEQDGRAAHVRRTGWRLMRDIDSPPWSVFEAWNGLFEGALSVHNRFLVLECLGREDYGDPHTHWRIRTRG
ncbi:MAG: hypothetical protein KDK91_16760 [Gammaproteobacteria bacterium]|nr:hypothetical protein [Gammaproteobacteria bacterium]